MSFIHAFIHEKIQFHSMSPLFTVKSFRMIHFSPDHSRKKRIAYGANKCLIPSERNIRMQDSTDMLNSANSWYTLGNVDDDEQERTCVPAHRVLRLQVGRVAIHAKKWKQPSYLGTTT